MRPLTPFLSLFLLLGCMPYGRPNNSYRSSLRAEFSNLKYQYLPPSQTHDYSGNWDFDGDGVLDNLKFIGTGGAHLYYYLEITLSTIEAKQSFRFLTSDFPILGTALALHDTLNSEKFIFPKFVVEDFDGDHLPEIFIHLDQQSFVASQTLLAQRGVTSARLILKWQGKAWCLNNFAIDHL
jgi:hypothetical protein